MFRKPLRLSLLPVLFLIAGLDANAEGRKFMLGTTVNMAGGGLDAPFGAGPGSPKNRSVYGEISPGLNLTSTGAHSSVQIAYGFALQRSGVASSMFGNSESHSASWILSSSPKRNLGIRISDSFQMSSNLTTTMIPMENSPDIPFAFNPIGVRQSIRVNTATAGVDFRPGAHSTVSVNMAHSLLKFGNNLFSGALSSQQSISPSVSYSHRPTGRDTWNIRYAGTFMAFAAFANSRSHAVSLGYTRRLSPNVTFELTGGPSLVEFPVQGGGYASYNASASLRKAIAKGDSLSLSYAYVAGNSSGLGSVSDNRTASLGINHLIGRSGSIALNLSGFETRGRNDNPFSTRGVTASASAGFSLSRRVSLRWGVQYQRYDRRTPFGFEQKRLFMSLGFRAPDLWTRV